jgi:hypothetical protein
MGLLAVLGVIAIVIGFIGLVGWIKIGLVLCILFIVGGLLLVVFFGRTYYTNRRV